MRGRVSVTEAKQQWFSMLGPLVEAMPTAEAPERLAWVRRQIQASLENLGFVVRLVGEEPAPILVATRSGDGDHALGLAGHYDVEEAGEGWTLRADTITERRGRLFGRGTGDNLGPLCLRLATLATRTGPCPPLVWVLQGQEEVGSEVAHATYPTLDLPDVALWVEETGYFEEDGTQRLLVKDLDAFGSALRDVVIRTAEADDRRVEVHERYLNKAFGQHRCPFLVHLAAGKPYIALGPNDPSTHIHAPDESLPMSTIDISIQQFDTLLAAAVA